jgi:hypothetical protein
MVDVIAREDGGRKTRQFEKDGPKLKVGVLRLKATLDQRERCAERDPERRLCFDGFRMHRGRDGDRI